MGWSIGYDTKWKRDVGYGVPAICDHPGCGKQIHRGLSYVCGAEMYGGESGCGLYFCHAHMAISQHCERCCNEQEPFEKKPDTAEWVNHKLTDESWGPWRDENPDEVERLKAAYGAGQ